MSRIVIEAEPEPIAVNLDRAALVIIDMQRDFLQPGGFGETLGNDVSLLQKTIEPLKAPQGHFRDSHAGGSPR
jgi:nicotinamidase-related amidase